MDADPGREDDLIPISALQHLLYCPRQFALIHLERQWAENRFTAEGRVLHDKTDEGGSTTRDGVKTIRSMPLRSLALQIAGVADVVETHRSAGETRPFPVEYKRGKPKAHRADEVQLCAQALCLEEMFGCAVNEGALFYGKTRRRHAVIFDAELRELTRRVAAEARAILDARRTPSPVYELRKCDACSLLEICRPKQLTVPVSAAAWLASVVEED
ncbi:MAG: CRISPR-associated protein Cas4 [Alphaproteobacteria bacterium]|nr:CRISPR-associated protein Cas4 [Alphaproteobacteria bacterium]